MADVTFTPDFKEFNAELEKIIKRQEALKNVTASFGKEGAKAYTQLEAAAKRAAAGPSQWTLALQANTAAQQAQVKALSDFRGQVNLGLESLGKFGGALNLIDGRLGGVVGALQQSIGVLAGASGGAELLGSGLTVAAGGAAALALAASPLVALWADYTAEQDRATIALEAWNKAQDDALPLTDRALAAVKELKLETSGLSDAEKARSKIALDYDKQLASANATLDERIALVEQELETARKSGPTYAGLVQELASLNEEREANIRTASLGLAAELALIDARDELSETTRQLEGQEKDRATASKDAEAEQAKIDKEVYERRRAYMRQLEEEKALKAALGKATFEQAEAEQQALIDVGLAREERFLREQEQHQEYLKMAKEREAQQRRQIGYLADTVGATSGLLDTLYNEQAAMAEDGDARQKAAALRTFHARQALAITEAGINTGLAASAALATPPAPNVIAAAAATALGLAQVASIASQAPPTFDDTPGVMQVGSSRQDVNFKEGDLFLASQTTQGLLGQIVGLLGSDRGGRAAPAGGRRSRLRDSLARDPAQIVGSDVRRVLRGMR